MNFQPAIKWSGSKRSQSDTIVDQFPDEIHTYYEPFVGGGSILYALLKSKKKAERYICSDNNADLINLWVEMKERPADLLDTYEEMWNELNADDNGQRKKDYYNLVRKRFNEEKNPADFMFLNRTCTNGLIRYNSRGEFNSSFHFSRKGILPETVRKIVTEWSELINQHHVEFLLKDYLEVVTAPGDVLYCDPPYAATKGMYSGVLNYEEFFEWLGSQEGKILLSFDGKRGENDYTYEVPKNIYTNHLYIASGVSSFTRLKTKEVTQVYESLYIG